MYILVGDINYAVQTPLFVAEKKKTILKYLKDNGYKYNKEWDFYYKKCEGEKESCSRIQEVELLKEENK